MASTSGGEAEIGLSGRWRQRLIVGRTQAARAYAVAFVIMLGALGARAALDMAFVGIAPFITLFPAVVLVGLCCGTAPGVVVGALGAAVANFLWLEPRFAFWPLMSGDVVNLVTFMLACALILWTTAALRQALLEADRARTMLHIALSQGDVSTWELDPATLRVRASGGAHRIHDIPDDGRSRHLNEWMARVHPDDAKRIRQTALKAIECLGNISEEFRLLRPNGSVRWVESRGGPVSVGGQRRLVGVLIDITDRITAEQTLRAQEERLQIALQAGGLGTWETDVATGRSRWDARLASMLGLPSEPVEIGPDRMVNFIHPEDRERATREFEAAGKSGVPYVSEFRGVTATGAVRWFASHGLVLAGTDGTGQAIGVTRDVTDRRRREDDLKEAVAAREMLVREADHRIKNSLQLVVSVLRLQRARLSDLEAQEALASAIGRVEAVAQSHQALQQSKDLKTVDFGDALRDLCGKLGQLNPDIETRCGFEQDLDLDAERAIPLALIISELLTNALRHAYPERAGSIMVDAMAMDDTLAVTVSDQGVGLPAAGGRTGLGSTVVRTLARQIGAEVVVRSAPGQGTTVTLKLPRHAMMAAG